MVVVYLPDNWDDLDDAARLRCARREGYSTVEDFVAAAEWTTFVMNRPPDYPYIID
ncbi:MAG: hypothetical protein JST64_00880 [Actinobacteria bacterium]|nr:hypothetical protein [Actinomycetota bacterium]